MRPQRDRRCSEINFLTSPSFNGSLRPLTFQQAKTIADKRKRQPVRVTLSSTSKRGNYSCFYSSWVTEHGPYCPKSQQLTNRPRGFRSGVGDRGSSVPRSLDGPAWVRGASETLSGGGPGGLRGAVRWEIRRARIHLINRSSITRIRGENVLSHAWRATSSILH